MVDFSNRTRTGYGSAIIPPSRVAAAVGGYLLWMAIMESRWSEGGNVGGRVDNEGGGQGAAVGKAEGWEVELRREEQISGGRGLFRAEVVGR